MMSHLSPQDTAIYTKVFEGMDSNKDGYLDKDEINAVFAVLGFKYTPEQIHEMIVERDVDCDDRVSLAEYLAVLAPIDPWIKRVAHLRRFFIDSDTNKDGFLSAEELKRKINTAVKETGVILSDTQIQGLMSEVDINRDGKIDYEEFLNLFGALDVQNIQSGKDR